jgi:hypothetical protein
LSSFEKFKETIRNEILEMERSKEKVVLFGGADVGIIAKKVLDYMDIEAECFCDNDPIKQSKVIEGLQVLPLDKVIINNKTFIVCTFSTYNEKIITKTLKDIGVQNIYSIYSILFIYKTRVVKYPIEEEQMLSSLYSFKEFNDNQIIENLNIPVTEKCTLRCEKCSALIPYNNNPNHFDKDIILNSINRFFEAIDGVKRVVISGGEPLLYPYLLEILEKVAKSPKVLSIRIITNGTVIPDINLLKSFRDMGISLSISDYGKLSHKKDELIELCNNYKVLWDVNTYSYNRWIDFGPFDTMRNRTRDENIEIFKRCRDWIKAGYLLDAKYYLCHRSAYISYLKVIENEEEGNYVNLVDYNISIEELKNKIKDLNDVKYLNACDYCNTRFGKIISPAIQTKEI